VAISKVQGPVTAYTAGTPLAASFANTPTQGNLLIALGKGSNVITNASISGWTLATSTLAGTTGTIGLWYKIAGAAESKDVSLVWTGSTSTFIGIEEWTGISSSPLDKVANTNSDGSTVSSRSSGTTAATTVADELIIAGFGMGNNVTAGSLTNSFTAEWALSGYQYYLASKIVSSTGAQETTMSWTTARLAGGLIATFKGGATSTELVVDNATHTHTAGSPSFATRLVVSNSTHTLFSNQPPPPFAGVPDIGAYEWVPEDMVLTTGYLLVVADATHAHPVGAPVLSRNYVLVVDNSTSVQKAGAAALTQAQTLAVANATHSQTAGSFGLVLPIAGEVAVQGATHASTAGSPTLTQAHTLAVNNATSALTTVAINISQQHVLVVNNATHSQVSDEVVLKNEARLVVANATSPSTAGAVALSQAHRLNVAGGILGMVAGDIILIHNKTLVVSNSTHALTSDDIPISGIPFIVGLSDDTLAIGDEITITGMEFGGGVGTVTINGIEAVVTYWSQGTIVVTIPEGAW
jgi:hypothetical protein